MRRAAWTMVVAGALLVPAAALADEYHVYKNGNGECEIDSRSHDRWKNDRGTPARSASSAPKAAAAWWSHKADGARPAGRRLNPVLIVDPPAQSPGAIGTERGGSSPSRGPSRPE